MFSIQMCVFFPLSPVDGVYDPGAWLHPCISLLPHHPLLPVWAQRRPHRSARGAHHHHPPHRPCDTLCLLCGLLHPAAESTDSHDERHALEGGAGERRAVEDTGNTHTHARTHAHTHAHTHTHTHLTDLNAGVWMCRNTSCIPVSYVRHVTWRDVTWRDVTWRDVTWRDAMCR